MNAVEILALIFSLIVIAKLLTLLIFPKIFDKMAKKVPKKAGSLSFLFYGLIILVGYFVLTNINIVTVLASLFFGHMLLGVVFLQYPEVYTSLSKVMLKDKRRLILPFLIYTALSLWALIVLFF